jgi:hypothetical protein
MLRFRDLGDEVHLWFEQRVPWKVALQILEALKNDAAERSRGDLPPQPHAERTGEAAPE